MGNLTIRNRSLSTKAEYVDQTSGLKIDMNYQEDAVNNTLMSISGTITKVADMSYAGNFNGQMNADDGQIEYSISGVKSRDMANVYSAIADIEEQITASQTENEGGDE